MTRERWRRMIKNAAQDEEKLEALTDLAMEFQDGTRLLRDKYFTTGGRLPDLIEEAVGYAKQYRDTD